MRRCYIFYVRMAPLHCFIYLYNIAEVTYVVNGRSLHNIELRYEVRNDRGQNRTYFHGHDLRDAKTKGRFKISNMFHILNQIMDYFNAGAFHNLVINEQYLFSPPPELYIGNRVQ
jgi:hypothetical protein